MFNDLDAILKQMREGDKRVAVTEEILAVSSIFKLALPAVVTAIGKDATPEEVVSHTMAIARESLVQLGVVVADVRKKHGLE